jgi:hypothetical protein
MVSRNDITNDKIQTKGVLSKEGEDNWDLIFGKKSKEHLTKDVDLDVLNANMESINVNVTTDQTTEVEQYSKEIVKLTQDEANSIETIEAFINMHKEKKKSRIDTVGQNGNDGLHYEYELNKSTGEVEKVDVKKLTDAFNGH